MNRLEKAELVSLMRERLSSASLVVVTRQVGLTVAEVSDLRAKMREADSEYKVVKNTLAHIAVQGTSLEGLSSMFTGPMALAYSVDPINAAKVIAKFANTNDKLKIVGGVLNGQVLDEAGVKALATLPSLDELRGKLVGLVLAPATKLATLLQEPAARVARVIQAKSA
jgi:large subunit ribosomal protein L10